MNNDFPRILSLLRKERGLSQKQVAEDLGVAQALLSHYENGKRECGLEFLLKAADYYNVSTDYLLGRSPVSNGVIITEKDIPDSDVNEKQKERSEGLAITLNKKLITSSTDTIYSMLSKINSDKLTKSVSSMLMLSVYKVFRIIFTTNNKNDRNMFKISDDSVPYLISSVMSIDELNAVEAAKNDAESSPTITTNLIESQYDKKGTALLSLIKNTESRILKDKSQKAE